MKTKEEIKKAIEIIKRRGFVSTKDSRYIKLKELEEELKK